MVKPARWTPYPEIDALAHSLLGSLREVLGTGFVGLYLHGSLAYGGFDPTTSDVDFLVVTSAPVAGEALAGLAEMHAGLTAGGRPWADRLEGAYVPRNSLRRHDPAAPPVPWLGVDGRFALERLGRDWIVQRWILRERGIAVSGPPAATLIDPIGVDDLREAVRGSLSEWWSPPFPDPGRFEDDGYRAYAVLTMCRSLYLLERGVIASKPEAALWAVRSLARPWASLAAEAAAWREGAGFAPWERTLGIIFFTLEAWGLAPR
jgi:hypothetical protein